MRNYTNNPRKITKNQLTRLKESLAEYGDLSAIVHDLDTDEIIGGNQRALALNLDRPVITERFEPPLNDGTAAVGYFEVEGKRYAYRAVSGWDDKKRRLANLIANHGGGSDDWDLLANYDPTELAFVGFDTEMLAAVKTAASALELLMAAEETIAPDAEPQVDKADQLQKAWATAPFQVWRMGSHRLYIGDATDPHGTEKFMDGDLADLVYTDPPYGVSYTGVDNEDGKEWAKIANDDLRGQGLREFLSLAFSNMHALSKENVAIYCWHASRNQIDFELALNEAGWTIKQQLIWNKGMVLGRSDYHWAHEPLFYGVKTGQSRQWYGDRSGKTILGLRRTDISKMSKEEMKTILQALLDNTTTWEIDRDAFKEYQHSTQKPTKLATRAIMNNSLEDQVVIDFFAGSGSTGIACENAGRQARLIEQDPKYAAVILQRFRDTYPGMKIEKLHD